MILDQIKKNLEKQIFAVFGLPKNFEIKWQTPPNPAWGDLALPIFEIAKTPKVQGDEIVKKVQKLKLPASVEKIETKAGYVNFFLEPNFLARGLAKELAAKSLGKKNSGKKKTIMLEFSQPNTHKEFHVGHLRGSVLGQSLVNILQAHGDKVIAANYLGDVGAHVAKWLWCYKKWHDGEEPGADKAKFLSKIYQEAAKKSEANPEHKKEVAQIQKKLEQGDRTLLRVWKKTRKWSIDEFKKIYKILGVNFDIYFYESEEEAPGKKIVEKLRRRGIAKTSRGAAVMDLEKYNLEIFLLQKADGAALYATKDLALAFKKFKKYKIDESWHLVDVRQTLYFRQLFKTLRLAGLKKIFKHLAYEFVSLPEGVISSRSGRMVGFNEIFEKVSGLAAQETAKRHKGWPKKKIERASRAIALAAMKFDMLKQSREKQIIFDPKQALSFEGFTGPYLLYTLARINSIQRRAGRGIEKIKHRDKLKIEPIEKQLLVKLAQFSQITAAAARQAEPALVAQYLFDLCKTFAEFYHAVNVLKAEPAERVWRLELIKNIKQVLEYGLELLSIEYLDEM